jgi:hypothetical protein
MLFKANDAVIELPGLTLTSGKLPQGFAMGAGG